MKKRLLSIVVVAVLALSLFVACGSDAPVGNEDNQATNEADDEIDNDEADDEAPAQGNGGSDENTLVVWCWDPAFNINAMLEAEAIFQQINPDFRLEIVETPWATMETALVTAASSGNLDALPDIMLVQDTTFHKWVQIFPGIFYDLTDSDIAFHEFAPAKLSMLSLDGRHYGVPFDNATAVTALREDVLAEAGLTIDDFTNITWDEFIELGLIVLEETGMPLIPDRAERTDVFTVMLNSTDTRLFDTDGNPVIDSAPAIRAIVEQYVELVETGVLLQVNDWDQFVGAFTTGTTAGVVQGNWIMASIQTAEDQFGDWRITNTPRVATVPSSTNYSFQGGASWAISGASENTQLAIDFLSATFGASMELYDNILPTGAIGTWLPAGDSDAYAVPHDFFGGQYVFQDVMSFSAQIIENLDPNGVFFFEARNAVGVAIVNILAGADIDEELRIAQETVEFIMGQ